MSAERACSVTHSCKSRFVTVSISIGREVASVNSLARLLQGRPAMLNVIPYNPVAGLPYATPSRSAQEQFMEVLNARGVNVQIRQRKGSRIDAACGQLRRLQPALK